MTTFDRRDAAEADAVDYDLRPSADDMRLVRDGGTPLLTVRSACGRGVGRFLLIVDDVNPPWCDPDAGRRLADGLSRLGLRGDGGGRIDGPVFRAYAARRDAFTDAFTPVALFLLSGWSLARRGGVHGLSTGGRTPFPRVTLHLPPAGDHASDASRR